MPTLALTRSYESWQRSYACGRLTPMTNTKDWGPRLYAYLERYWATHDTNRNAWSGVHAGVEPVTLYGWKKGNIPSLTTMQAVATALGATMLDLLIVAGVVDKKEVGHDAASPEAPSIDDAIRLDPTLSAAQRRDLTEVLQGMREYAALRASVTQKQRAARRK